MTEPPGPRDKSIASAADRLSADAAELIRRELDVIKREMLDKAGEWAPAAVSATVAAAGSLFAGASIYRLAMRAFERALGPVGGPLGAAVAFAAVAAAAARSAATRVKDAPLPLPTGAARQTMQGLDPGGGGSL